MARLIEVREPLRVDAEMAVSIKRDQQHRPVVRLPVRRREVVACREESYEPPGVHYLIVVAMLALRIGREQPSSQCMRTIATTQKREWRAGAARAAPCSPAARTGGAHDDCESVSLAESGGDIGPKLRYHLTALGAVHPAAHRAVRVRRVAP